MSTIHVKDSVLKALPNIFHPLTPPLFVEQGQMPCHDKNKSKSAIIYVNLCGVYFIRPISFSKKYKLSQFISTYDVSQIEYKDKNQCEIVTRTKSLFIHCDHCEEAVSAVLSSRELLFKDLKQPSRIQLIDFPSIPPSPSLPVQPDVSIITLRYIAMCSKKSFIPEGRILDVFNKFNPTHHITLTLDETCIAPPVVKNLLYPIFTFKHIQILRLKNFSPYFVCRFLHHLIKRAFKVDTIIIEGYSRLVPEQLRMDHTRGLRPLSIIFKNCYLNDDTNERLFEQLGKYPGEFSRLSIINCSLGSAGWKSLFDTLTQERAFKELEMFEVDNVDSNALYDDQVTESVKTLLKHCRCIMRLSVSNWTQPIHFGINNFQNYLLLSEINLAGQDMTQPLPDDFRMLRMVHCLNLNKCNFTFNSLQSLFKTLSTARTPITVRLADIKLPESHWKNFYANLNTFPPLNTLYELDWSGNHLYTENISNFTQYFFSGNKLKYLQIDRIFNSQQAEDLYNLLKPLSDKSLLGISIGGSPETNFSGNLKSLLRAVELLMNLHILRLDGQKITDLDAVSLVNYLKIQKTLNDVSFDDTSINDQQRFFDFYRDVCSLNIDAVGRPFKDLNRLFGADLSSVINPSHYDEFQSQIRLKSDKILDSCRQFYFCKFLGSDFDPKIYIWFGECYPSTFLDESRYDTFGLKKENMRHPMPTLCAIAHKTLLRTLSAYHQRYLTPPERMPRYRIKLDTFQPTFLADPNNTEEQSFPYLNQEFNYDDDLTQTGNFGFGFGTMIANQNLGDIYNTTALYDTQNYDQQNFDQQPVYDQNEQFDQQQFDHQQFDQQQFDQQQFDQPQYDSSQQFDQQFTTQQFDQQQFDQTPQFDQQQYDQPQYDQFEQTPQYDQQQFDQTPQFQQFDQTPQFQQFDQPQFEQQQFEQQNFTPQFQQDFSYDSSQQFIPQPEFNANQFGQQQFEQPQFDQQQFDQTPQFQQLDQQQFNPQQFDQQQVDQTQYTVENPALERQLPLIPQPIQPQNTVTIEQQQPQQYDQHHGENFSKTLNRFMSHGNIEYEDQAPELPSLRSDISQTTKSSEVTEVKPLLQCTIKPRDKTVEQPVNVPPPMFPINSSGSTGTENSSSSFLIPPPSDTINTSNLNFPSTLTNQPFIPAPVPVQSFGQAVQKTQVEPVTVPAPTPVQPTPQIIPPPQNQVESPQIVPPPQSTQQQTPSMQKITVIAPSQPQLQQHEQHAEPQPAQEAPLEPKVTVERTVTVTEHIIEKPQPQNIEKPQVPDLRGPTLSPTPPVFIPPPDTIVAPPQTTATPLPVIKNPDTQTSKTSDIPVAPARKKKPSQFQSSAGSLKLPSSAGLGNISQTPSQRTVKVDGGKVVEIPNETTLQPPEPVHQWTPFDDIDIPDLTITSNAASRQEVPKLIVIDTPTSVENFYQSNNMPFELPQPTSSLKIGAMSHPLQSRVFLKPPNIKILGVPNEW